jgi:four helix bundle protein
MQDNKYDLEERTLNFSTNVVKYCYKVKQPLAKTVVEQLVRSATSIGANYCEANNAVSKQDFRSKIYIAKKEASETKYWLKLLATLGDSSDERAVLEKETQELIMILQKISNSLRG